jgi:fumarylacetoacetase
MTTNNTHSPNRRSWIESANTPETDFPIQNLPLGVFRTEKSFRKIGVAIGDSILDLAALSESGLLNALPKELRQSCKDASLNRMMRLGNSDHSRLREVISTVLASDAPKDTQEKLKRFLVPINAARMEMPCTIGDYTDFYASIYHATNVGSMFRPDNPLLPNYKYIPIGYHGRASSIRTSGFPVKRPHGQTRPNDNEPPLFGVSKQLDYELELGAFIGKGNSIGEPLSMQGAEESLFGLCLLNDWSARDIQKWEYQPLGPFLAKNFLTTISCWIITNEALAPFRVPAFVRAESDPKPLPYLTSEVNDESGAFSITLEVYLASEKMRNEAIAPFRISKGNFKDMYWTLAQLIAHHASNGCNLRGGDLLGSGTISGKTRDEAGCLLERTWRGTEPISLPTGETRKFLETGDEVSFKAYAEAANAVRIGFGECKGIIV